MFRRSTRLLALVVTAAAFDGCAGRPPDAAIPGTYVYVRGPAVDTLVVRADGRWTRRLTAAGRLVATDSGPWAIEGVTGERWVELDSIDPEPGLDGGGSRGTWPAAPERPFFGMAGTIRLPLSAEEDERAFVRVGPVP